MRYYTRGVYLMIMAVALVTLMFLLGRNYDELAYPVIDKLIN